MDRSEGMDRMDRMDCMMIGIPYRQEKIGFEAGSWFHIHMEDDAKTGDLLDLTTKGGRRTCAMVAECASSVAERIDMHGRGNRANTSRVLAHCGRRGTCEGMDERVTGERGQVI